MRTFKLLKDLPDCPKGAIGREEAYEIVIWEGSDGYTQYTIKFILSRPDWFEEVVEEEKRYAICQYPPCGRPTDGDKFCDRHNPKPTPKKIELFYAGEFCAKNELDNKVNLMNKINELIIAINEMRGAV